MGIIELYNVYKKCQNHSVINNLNFSFEEKIFYVISGESGCGKTTLLNMIADYIKPDSGEIRTAAKIGYLFQEDMIFSNLTVAENMRICLYAQKDMECGDLDLISATLSNLYIENLIYQKAAYLSGGEKQRVQLANILLSKPDVVLMDEPTSKLDDDNKANIIELIQKVFKNKTVIIITHEKSWFNDGFVHLKLKEGIIQYEER